MRMIPKNNTEIKPHENEVHDSQPLALLYCTDLMFGVQLQNMARKTGYRFQNVRPGTPLPDAAVLVVDLGARGEWEAIIREAASRDIPTIAFGPHMDAEARRKARSAGATRVLANSNLARDLPTILLNLLDEGTKRQDAEAPRTRQD